MSRTGHNTEACELTESELDKISGGKERTTADHINAWYEAMGRVGITLPNQGNPFTDSLGCQTT